MRRYVIKRCLLAVPVLLLVMVLAFTLSRLVPGDGATAALSLQGMDPGSSMYVQEYRRQYLSLGLDKPYFYFSILPDYYPANLNSEADPTRRQEIASLLKERIHFDSIHRYLNAREHYLDELATLPDLKMPEYHEIKRKLLFAQRLSDIQQLILVLHPPFSEVRNYRPFVTSIRGLESGLNQGYLPVFRWHGKDNQFHKWFSGIINGNMGFSFRDGRQVSEKIASAMQWTLLLLVLNIAFSLLVSIPSGLFAGFNAGGRFDKYSNIIWLIFYTMPVFWLASVLIIYFTSAEYGKWMDIFPLPGLWMVPEGTSFIASAYNFAGYLILPVLCLAANDIAFISRIVRDNVVEQKSKLYVLMARARGLSERYVARNHILPNIMVSLVTVVGGRISASLAGSLLVEIIFGIPGMGRLLHQSINTADWNVVFGILVVISLFTFFCMLVTDVVYAWINPKIRFET